MPLVFRRIKQAKWAKSETLPWLKKGDIPADPLGDLATADNKLSVFLVEDSRQNLEQVIAALAATNQKPDKFDYLLFNIRVLSDCSIMTQESQGKTPDAEVNSWHLDLVQLSGLKLVDLVRRVFDSNYQTGRFQPKQVVCLVSNAVRSGRISLDRLPESFLTVI